MNKKLFKEPDFEESRKHLRDACTIESAFMLLMRQTEGLHQDKRFINLERSELEIWEYFETENNEEEAAGVKGKKLNNAEEFGLFLRFTPSQFFWNFWGIVKFLASEEELPYKNLVYNFHSKTPYIVFCNGRSLTTK